MRRILELRSDTLTDLTPADLTVVLAGQGPSVPCGTSDIGQLRPPTEIIGTVVPTVFGCPMSRGCPTTRYDA